MRSRETRLVAPRWHNPMATGSREPDRTRRRFAPVSGGPAVADERARRRGRSLLGRAPVGAWLRSRDSSRPADRLSPAPPVRTILHPVLNLLIDYLLAGRLRGCA